MRIFLFGCVFASFSFLSAEYLVLDRSNSDLKPSRNDWPGIYTVIQKYAWPTSIIHINEAKAANNQSEINLFRNQHELDTVRRKLQEIKPTLEAYFIPQTLYEIIAMGKLFSFSRKIPILIGKFIGHPGIGLDRRIIDILQEADSSPVGTQNENAELLKVLNEYKQINYLHDSIDLAFEINNYEYDFFKENNGLAAVLVDPRNTPVAFPTLVPLVGIIAHKLRVLSDSILRRKDRLSDIGNALRQLSAKIVERAIVDDLDKIIINEYQAFIGGRGLLYRGTKSQPYVIPLHVPSVDFPSGRTTIYPIENPFILDEEGLEILKDEGESSEEWRDKQFDRNDQLRSISYGNSLFAGIGDNAACAYTYFFSSVPANDIDSNDNISYLLSVAKQDYYFTNLPKLFIVSPLASVPALCAINELFHSRSMMYLGNTGDYLGSRGGLGLGMEYEPEESINYLSREENPLRGAFEIARYIADHAIIIKVPRPRGDVPYRAIELYQEDQRKLVDIFEKYYKFRPTVSKIGSMYKQHKNKIFVREEKKRFYKHHPYQRQKKAPAFQSDIIRSPGINPIFTQKMD